MSKVALIGRLDTMLHLVIIGLLAMTDNQAKDHSNNLLVMADNFLTVVQTDTINQIQDTAKPIINPHPLITVKHPLDTIKHTTAKHRLHMVGKYHILVIILARLAHQPMVLLWLPIYWPNLTSQSLALLRASQIKMDIILKGPINKLHV